MTSYTYDGEGRVCAVQTAPYTGGLVAYGYLYDAEGRRVAKGTITPNASQPCNPASNGFTLTESYVLGQSGETLTTLNGAGAWQRTNVYGAGQLLASYDAAGLHFPLTDPLGTRRVQTNSIGEAELDCQSLPFGDQQSCFADPSAPNDDANADATGAQTGMHFTGKERDAESGLDYFGARYYGSSMGRFMSPDPSGLAYANPANPQSLNLYSYALNNPLINIDPTGMECVWDDGSYDAADDAQTGNAAGCSGQGGTYVNPDLFENALLTNGQNANIQYGSWSGSANSTLASSWTTASVTATANLSTTPTLQDASTFYQMWLSGVGPATLNYGPNDGATKQLAQTPTAQGLRQQYIDASCPGSASYPSGHVGPWLHGYGTLNATEMQVGGFNESMSSSGGTTTYTITNTAGQASYSGATTSQTMAALNPFNSNGTTDNPYGPNGPRHNIEQTFSWTEPTPCGH